MTSINPERTGPRRVGRRWPLLVIGASAGAATWSGWVGLGGLTGFGVMKPFPGIPGLEDVQINTAILLPIGVEAYAVYALAVATSTEALTGRARRFAWVSSFAALGLGMVGQAAYHLMAAAGITSAHPAVVILVSCIPVLLVGAASVLWHLASESVTPIESTADRVGSTPPAVDRVDPIESIESIGWGESIRRASERELARSSAGAVALAVVADRVEESIGGDAVVARAADVDAVRSAVRAGELARPLRVEHVRTHLRIGPKYARAAIAEAEARGYEDDEIQEASRQG